MTVVSGFEVDEHGAAGGHNGVVGAGVTVYAACRRLGVILAELQDDLAKSMVVLGDRQSWGEQVDQRHRRAK